MERERVENGAQGVYVQRTSGRDNRSFEAGASTLQDIACEGPCRVLLFTMPSHPGRVRLEGEADGPLRWLDEPEEQYAGVAAEGAPDSFLYRASDGWLVARSEPAPDALALTAARPGAEGTVGILLWNATATLVDEEGAHELRTGRSILDEPGPAGVSTGRRVRESFLVLVFHAASLEVAPGAPVRLVASSWDVELEGRILAASAFGALQVDGRRHELSGESLRLDGVFSLASGSRSALAIPAGGSMGDRSAEARLDGTARAVSVGGQAFSSPVVDPAPALVAGAGLAALLAAWLAFGRGLFPLYMRVDRASVLRNPNRASIVETVRAEPGINATQLAKRLGLARVVVQHHIRMLEAHQHLASRLVGARRGYFVPEHACAREGARERVLLRDATRRAIAGLVAASPTPVSQRDIVQATGLPQRVVSYHLVVLEKEGLVETIGSMPRRYRGLDHLRRQLDAPYASSA